MVVGDGESQAPPPGTPCRRYGLLRCAQLTAESPFQPCHAAGAAKTANDGRTATEGTALLGGGGAQGKTSAKLQMFGLDVFGPLFRLHKLRKQFGVPLLLTLVCSQPFIKGCHSCFVSMLAQYLYKGLGVNGQRTLIFGGVTALPWAMTPLVGLVSDFVLIAGYTSPPTWCSAPCSASAPACTSRLGHGA